MLLIFAPLFLCLLGLAKVDAQRSVTVFNNLDGILDVVWTDGDKEIKIIDVPPLSSASMQTFDGHAFLAYDQDDAGDVHEFTITKGQDDYHVPPLEESDLDAARINADGEINRKFEETMAFLTTSNLGDMPKGKEGKVYADVGADGSTEGQHPRVRIMNKVSNSVAAKFKSLYPLSLDMWYEDGRGGSAQGVLRSGRETTTNTYHGHVFFFTVTGDRSKEVARLTMSRSQGTYVIRGSAEDDAKLDPTLIDVSLKAHNFMQDYQEKNGLEWRHYYGPNGPRPPPVLHMWPADYVGQVHSVVSQQGYWECGLGDKDITTEDEVEIDDAPSSNAKEGQCKSSKESFPLYLQVVSQEPRAFIIEDFLNEYECDSIIATAKPLIKESTVGQSDSGGVRSSETRTSSNAWVPRSASKVTETLFRRAADVLNVSHTMLVPGQNAEDMQVVHYKLNQKYDSHHDWGVSGYPESRYITLLLYLNDMEHVTAGGETAFPKGADGLGFKVLPKKGMAVLFYSLLEDGNGDDLSLHAALPLIHGDKWLANFWVWDPKRR